MLGWFDTKATDDFGRELAAFVMKELADAGDLKEPKFRKRIDKVMNRAEDRVRDFKATHSLNFYKKSQLANKFLWALKDAGCAEDVAAQMTDWLTLRL